MKHKVKAPYYEDFNRLFNGLQARLKETGERIVKARFSFSYEWQFKATVWTERDKVEAK